ncbi:DUF4869 domain-containing protein [Anaerotruncus sp. 80]|uniref:DUF4869 domain-containing protein n=1 Tax=Anaerotruncus colihominis TaxID=169435 RepID=A0A845QLN4_9FIRM|nr:MULTISPECIES: DUF4869 domain-containing protein [Anaerotruncus]NBH63010.1 DUF4869 domain-containing protein [Anaerotruncus colihominis]NCF03664.1 DUF4869 domain-containing protein [Anaerotruncus sp. 80]
MLNIYFGEMPETDFPNYVYNTSVYFDNTYLDDWITDEFSQKMIKNIDRAEVISAGAVDSRALGVIPVKQLSGGVKTLLLIQHDSSKIFNASTCGDNCAKWILKIAEDADRDIVINLRHLMDFGEKPFTFKIINSGKVVHNMQEYVLSAGMYL